MKAILLLVAIATLAVCDDITTTITSVQTRPTPTSAPPLTGTAIGVTETTGKPNGDDDLNIFLSRDLHDAMQNVRQSQCKGKVTDECINALAQLVDNASPVISGSLQSRGLFVLSAFTLVRAVSLFLTVVTDPAIIIPLAFTVGLNLYLDYSKSPPDKAVVNPPGLGASATIGPPGAGATTTATSSLLKQNWVILPTSTPNSKDDQPDIKIRQPARIDFENHVQKDLKIELKRFSSGPYIELWTADLDTFELAAIRATGFCEDLVPNGPVSWTDFRSQSARDVTLQDEDMGTTPNATRKSASLVRRDLQPDFTNQANAGFELHTLTDLNAVAGAKGDYNFLQSGGQESAIYVIERDSFVITHPEIGRTQNDVDWIGDDMGPPQANLIARFNQPGSDHATAVLSKLVGTTVGVARKARPVLVNFGGSDVAQHLADWRELVQDVMKRKHGSSQNVIINWSGGQNIPFGSWDQYTKSIEKRFNDLQRERVITVLAAGNKNDDQSPPGMVPSPQQFALENSKYNILMAGHTDANSVPQLIPDHFSNVWAVAKGIQAADGTTGLLREASGSSFAAPQIAGLIALLFEDTRTQITDYWDRGGKTTFAVERLLTKAISYLRANVPNNAKPIPYNYALDPWCPLDFFLPPTEDANTILPRQNAQCLKPGGDGGGTGSPTKYPQITDGSNYGTCGTKDPAKHRIGTLGENSKVIDWNTLQGCLISLNDSHNGGTYLTSDPGAWLDAGVTPSRAHDCDGMVSFQSASHNWDDPLKCHDACKNCLSEAIVKGYNEMWCDASVPGTAAACWEGYTARPPPLTSGTGYPDSHIEQYIQDATSNTGINDAYIDEWKIHACLENWNIDRWLLDPDTLYCADDNDRILNFAMWSVSGPWNSPADCWNAIKNCLFDALIQGNAREAYCTAYYGAICKGGFYPRIGK